MLKFTVFFGMSCEYESGQKTEIQDRLMICIEKHKKCNCVLRKLIT